MRIVLWASIALFCVFAVLAAVIGDIAYVALAVATALEIGGLLWMWRGPRDVSLRTRRGRGWDGD